MSDDRGHGVVYTRDWVVDLMLDLADYADDVDLGAATIVEPGCGDGAFLRRIVPRLLRSAQSYGRPIESLANAIRAYELDPVAVEAARTSVVTTLVDMSVSSGLAKTLAASWVIRADFLLDDLDISARWVVGNPPYVRVEEADSSTYWSYRQRWKTMSGRADLYIGFFEAGLSILEEGGKLCFICADRWMHNQYGSGLRRYVIEDFALKLLLEVHRSDVFDVPVAAYPAITLMERAPHTVTVLATASDSFDAGAARRFSSWWSGNHTRNKRDPDFSASVVPGGFPSNGSWPSGPPERLRLIADLEKRLPALPEVGISIGVGIATGADKVYVVTDADGVEPQFLKKAVGPADLRGGKVEWSGRSIVSPWIGSDLIGLDAFPGVTSYFRKHSVTLQSRYVGKRNPDAWWRTIDRPPADDYRAPKLIVADINDRIEPVLDRDGYWPLHSAYYITSTDWDLEALGGYLLSDVSSAFVEAYSVKMANGHLRVSAQYLKRIRIPAFEEVPLALRRALQLAFQNRDRHGASRAVRTLIGLSLE